MPYLSISMITEIRYALLIIFCLGGIVVSNGQTIFQPKPIEYNLKGVLYDFESVFEGRIHAQGFSIGYKKGQLKSYYKTTYQNFEFGYIKDPRERRTNRNLSVSGFRTSSPFVYGKRNDFFQFRYSYGVKTYLSEKTRRKGVSVGFIYEGGATLGLLKPYTLQVIRIDEDNPTARTVETIRYSDDLRDDFLDFQNIYGGDTFFGGFSAIRPTVGLHGKIGMHWGIGAFESKVKAAETGIMFDIFPGKVPLLVEQDGIENSFYYFKIYLSFQFGKRTRIGEE